MSGIPEYYGCDVFNDRAMRSALTSEAYDKLQETITEGKQLDKSIANAVAAAMKNWAISKGATHYTHWFQPMTGITAEKHDSFICPQSDGSLIMEFSGKELIQGEPDASSFPSGGLRTTFEARGYTAWDPTSFAFIKGRTLCIPTAFCSYGGEALDKKTPLLRSMEALNVQALRILRLFGNTDAKRVIPMVGAEQEYFLIEKGPCAQRKDLILCGRTLFGAKPPKGQELDDHYFGTIKPRVLAFMEELNERLWRLGIPARTQHNEAAPCQHELAPVYESCNIATDHNQITMELMQKIAEKHGLVCLLHEKPFDGVNGSGKHNNWSMATDTGANLLSPGSTPEANAQFLLFLTAVIKAVDDYQDLLRFSVATAGNDHRLGASEAPPAIVSIYLGDELTAILDAMAKDTAYTSGETPVMRLGVPSLPDFTRDNTDRNRTSPLAFTGNKFEFRMLGASNTIACPNIMLNAAVADTLAQFADELEQSPDFESALRVLLKREISRHRRIIFNGNGYGDEWVEEATKTRGLLNLKTTPDCIGHLLDPKNCAMLSRTSVFSPAELQSRQKIQLENYCSTVLIEANTMVAMTNQDILPAMCATIRETAETANIKKAVCPDANAAYEMKLIRSLSLACEQASSRADALKLAAESAAALETGAKAALIKDTILPLMAELRNVCDQAEQMCPEKAWPFPTYSRLMFPLM